MNLGRAKSILIIAFVGLNIFLGYYLFWPDFGRLTQVAITAEELTIGSDTHIGYQALMTGKKIIIGSKCNINNRAFIEAYYAPIVIEDNVTIAGSAMISSHDGSFMNVLGKEMIAKPIILKKQCFIGNNAVILPGITVNEKAIVGAGAVVTKDVEKRTIVVGVPAKPIRKI